MPQPSDPDDKRQHPRHPVVLRAEYLDGRTYWSDWTENLSAGGFFIRTEEPYSVGETVRVRLSFPGLLEPLEVEGAVAWVRPESPERPRGIGVRVQNDAARRRLAEIALRLEPSSRASQRANSAYRILVVEDSRLLSEMYENALQRIGATWQRKLDVTFATNGHEALLTLKDGIFDLILADVYMPVMDGLALAKRRAEFKDPGVPILMITSGGDEAANKAIDAGVDAVLRKPVQFGELLETVVRLLA